MAQALGTSVMPVRDAVCRLVAERALVVYPNRTIGLPILTREQFLEICDVRAALEGLAAFQAATRIDPETITELRRLNSDMQRTREYPTYMLKNQHFHFAIYEAARMPFLIALIEMLWLQVGPLFNYIGRLADATRIPDRHSEAIAALSRKDPAASRRAIEEDIGASKKYLVDVFKESK